MSHVTVVTRHVYSGECTDVGYSPDGNYVVLGGDDISLQIFAQNLEVDEFAPESVTVDEPITCLVVSNTDIYTGARDGIVRQYKVRTKESLFAVGRYDLAIRCIALSPNKNFLAVGTESSDVKIINFDDIDECWNFKGHKKAINSLSFDPLGTFLISSSCDGTVRVWNMKTQEAISEHVISIRPPFGTEETARIAVAWHPSGEFFVAAKGQIVIVYHRDTWTKSFTYVNGPETDITHVSWSGNGKFLAVCSVNAEIHVWQYKKKHIPVFSRQHPRGRVVGLDWAPNANSLVICDTFGQIHRWDGVIDSSIGTPFNAPVDPLAGLFDDEAGEDEAEAEEDEAEAEKDETKTGKEAEAGEEENEAGKDADGDVNLPEHVEEKTKEPPVIVPDQRKSQSQGQGLDLGQGVGQDQDHDQEYMSEDESLKDFVVDDDNGGYLPPPRPPVEPRGSASSNKTQPGKLQPAKVLHACFQSGSTKLRDGQRYLDFNGLGTISTVEHDGGKASSISVEFHDKLSGRGYHFRDSNKFTMGCLGKIGSFFAAKASDGNPATIYYKTHEYLGSKYQWQNFLPEGEDVSAIALNALSAIVVTTRGYVRVFSQSGIQTGLFTVRSVIAAAGNDDLVILLYHLGEPFAGSQNLGYVIYNVETGQRIQQAQLPVADDTFVTWLGFSSGGIPAFYDDNGVMHILNYYRRVDQGQWTPILDTSLVVEELETVTTPHYWPVSLTDDVMKCVKCKRHETEPSFPKPFLTDLSLCMPTLYQDTPTGKLEEAWLRQKILAGLNKDENIAMSLDRSENTIARKELEMDKLAIQMIDIACQDAQSQKALDLTAMLCNVRAMDGAIQLAHRFNLNSLMERITMFRNHKLATAVNRDADAKADAAKVMADPEVAVRPSEDQSALLQVSSREEEEEQERKLVQRRAPVQANDPFGRRIVKDSKPAKTNTNINNNSSNGGISNPFKKSMGSALSAAGGEGAGAGAGGSLSNTGARGFGNVVKESDRYGGTLPITRRAADVFEAADLLSADEQRAQDERDQIRKRKANGASAGLGGQATVQQMFGKSAAAAATTAADSKRFKRASAEELAAASVEPEEVISDDVMMETDDFLEPELEDDMLDETQPPAAQRIPETQEDDDEEQEYGGYGSLDATIEETRGHLEKTKMASSSLSPASRKTSGGASSSSSSVLAGFKFHKS